MDIADEDEDGHVPGEDGHVVCPCGRCLKCDPHPLHSNSGPY